MTQFSEIQVSVQIPYVGCDICNRKSYVPAGIWNGSWSSGSVPPVLHLQRIANAHPSDPRPVFHVAGCANESEAEAMALENGWKQVTLRASIKLVCPECQALIAEINGGEAGGTQE